MVIGLAGEHDYLRRRPALIDRRQQAKSIGVRQLQVEEHYVGLLPVQRLVQGGAQSASER